MESSNNEIVDRASLGKPVFLSEEKHVEFTFNGFESLTEKKAYRNGIVTCHGLRWHLVIYPWGVNDEAKTGNQVSLLLHLTDPIDAKDSFRVKFTVYINGDRVEHNDWNDWRVYDSSHTNWGYRNLMKRAKVIEKLDPGGSLTIKVGIQGWFNTAPIWKPCNTLQQKALTLYNDDKSKDATFVFDGGDVVRVHRSILSIQCPGLHEIVSEDAAGDASIVIENTDADLFGILIRFMYLETLPITFALDKSGVELLQLADRFGYTDLKMYIEAAIVGSNLLTSDTAAYFLLLADSHSCALLKEAAMDVILAKPVEVMKTRGWQDLKASSKLVAEVFQLQVEGNKRDDKNRVSSLRKLLADNGKEVDGTKEMLVKRCRASVEAATSLVALERSASSDRVTTK